MGLPEGEKEMVATAYHYRSAADRDIDRSRWQYSCGAFCLHFILNND